MRREREIRGATIAALLMATGCSSSDGAAPQGQSSSTNVVAEIRAEEAQWNRDYVARDVDRIVDHYAPDAMIKLSGIPAFNNRVMRSAFEPMLADPAFVMVFASDRIHVSRSGDFAYSRGHYRMTQTDRQTNQATTEYGTYLTVWQRQPDNRWKVVEDFSAPGPRPVPM